MRLAFHNNFSIELICFDFDNWSRANNEKLLAEFSNVKIISIPAGRKPFWPWFISVVNEQISRKINLLFRVNIFLSSAVSRRSRLIIKNLNKVSRPDSIIGHNPGALYATRIAASKFNCKAGFDVEDYHPGEGNNKFLQQLSKKLMQKTLPIFDYVSFASPQIREAVKKDIGKEGNWFTVMNYFEAKEFAQSKNINGRLKLVWFSQNISFNRGLEQIIPVIKGNKEVELHLYGNCNKDFKREWVCDADNITLHPSISQISLHRQLSNYDVGLAIEPGKDLNNELALSNKLLAYFQAGLYILASNTKAQSTFIEEHPDHGIVSSLTANELNATINKLMEQKNALREASKDRFENAKQYCWENESKKLLKHWME